MAWNGNSGIDEKEAQLEVAELKRTLSEMTKLEVRPRLEGLGIKQER